MAEIPDNVKEGLKMIPVTHVAEVLKYAVGSEPEAIHWDEAAEEAAASAAAAVTVPSATAH